MFCPSKNVGGPPCISEVLQTNTEKTFGELATDFFGFQYYTKVLVKNLNKFTGLDDRWKTWINNNRATFTNNW